MNKLYNRKSQKEVRKKLRNQMTNAEKILWKELRRNNLGYKFRRQFGIGIYIVDFYCPQLKLVIEIDGITHILKEEIKNDKIRQSYLEELGIKVIRYKNWDIYHNMDIILEDILRICRILKNKQWDLS